MVNEIPLLGLGTWKIPKPQAKEVVYRSIKELNIRHIDCASDYGNEKEVGEGIKQAIDEGVVKREDLWITSKLWNTYHKEEHVLPACQKSLQDLQLTYFDLYLVHFPIALKYVPFEERYPPEWIHDPKGLNKIELANDAPLHLTWKAMEQLVYGGLTRHIGVANFNTQLLMDLVSYAKISPYLNQIEVHPYNTQEALIAFCSHLNIRVTAYSPFGAASYIELGADPGGNLLQEPVVLEVAKNHNKTATQVLLKWSTQRNISVIPKSSNIEHLRENAQINDFELSEEEVRTTWFNSFIYSLIVYSIYRRRKSQD